MPQKRTRVKPKNKGFPHPALALGDSAHAAQRIGMTDRRQRQPASDEAPHSVPENPAVLAPPPQRAMPIPTDAESKKRQRRLVHGHSVIAKVSTHNRPQPLALLGDGFVHASLKLGFHLIQLRLQPLTYRLPRHREPSIALLILYADVTSPLSTLRRRPRERLRMTQGRCGSLLHIRMNLSFSTPRRFNRRTGESQ
jgi:hypothetical protein